MSRLLVVAIASLLLIAFLSFVLGRLFRSRRRGLSIRMQIFIVLSMIVGTFAFGLGILVIDRVEARASRLAEAAAREEALALSALLAAELERTNAELPEVVAQLERVRARLPEKDAGLRRPPLGFGGLPREPEGLELLDRDGRQLYPADRAGIALEEGAVSVTVDLVVGGKRLGKLRVVKPTIAVRSMLADFAPTVLVISLVLGAVAALAAAFVGKKIAEPIEALSLFAEQVSEGKRAKLPVAVFGREVLRLVRSIDTMQRKLEGRAFVETFAADLSHELKNPVAAIFASSEVLLEGALEDEAHARKFVSRIHEAATRIERLLAELLDLAHLESRGTSQLSPVSLQKLCDDVIRSLVRGQERISVVVDPGARWRGDSVWLGRAVRNLIDNALTHSPPGSPVKLTSVANDSDYELVVENQGNIAETVRPSLFQRFMTTKRNEGGTGLGLSIVRAVAEAHSGTVEFRSYEPTVQVTLALPRT